MSEEFVTQLRLQLREAALREERRSPVARRVARARHGLPGPAPMVAALAVVLLAVAVAAGTLALRGEPAPTAPKLVGSYPVAAGLSSLASGFGAVWSADPVRGDVVRIDRGRPRVVARIPVGGEARVAAGAGAVWALAGDLLYAGDQGPVRLLRIDPASNRVVARIAMRGPGGQAFGPLGVQADGDAVWVVGSAGALRVDPRRNVADRFVAVKEQNRGVVGDGGSVWVLAADGRLRRLDAATGRTTDVVAAGAPAGTHLFAGRPGTLTLVGDGKVAVLDRGSGRRLWRTTLDGDVRSWHGDDDWLWAHASRDSARRDELVRLDAGTGRVQGRVSLPEPDAAGIATVGRDVWVATPGGRIVVVR